MSSLFDKVKRDNFLAPFLKASEATTKNGGVGGSISILVGNPYKKMETKCGFHFLRHTKERQSKCISRFKGSGVQVRHNTQVFYLTVIFRIQCPYEGRDTFTVLYVMHSLMYILSNWKM